MEDQRIVQVYKRFKMKRKYTVDKGSYSQIRLINLHTSYTQNPPPPHHHQHLIVFCFPSILLRFEWQFDNGSIQRNNNIEPLRQLFKYKPPKKMLHPAACSSRCCRTHILRCVPLCVNKSRFSEATEWPPFTFHYTQGNKQVNTLMK